MTLLIGNNEPFQSGQNPSPNDIHISGEVYDVIEFFYPHTDYFCLPQLHMRYEDIVNVMNCSKDESYEIAKAIWTRYGDTDLRIFVPHFCEYMGVDELFIYLFLVSFNNPRKISGNQNLEMQAIKLEQLCEKAERFLLPDCETLHELTRVWHILNPLGEPSCKPVPGWRMVIHADEVAVICRVSLRTAQEMLKHVRDEVKMQKKLPVSIRLFCYYWPAYTEEEIRIGLAAMYGEEYDDK
jgi:hypothetical protein